MKKNSQRVFFLRLFVFFGGLVVLWWVWVLSFCGGFGGLQVFVCCVCGRGCTGEESVLVAATAAAARRGHLLAGLAAVLRTLDWQETAIVTDALREGRQHLVDILRRVEANEDWCAWYRRAVDVHQDAVLAHQLPQVAEGGLGVIQDVGDNEGVVLGQAVLCDERALVEGLALVAGGCEPGAALGLTLRSRLVALDAHGAHRGGSTTGRASGLALLLSQLLDIQVVGVLHQAVSRPWEHVLTASHYAVQDHPSRATAALDHRLLERRDLDGGGGTGNAMCRRCGHCYCRGLEGAATRLLMALLCRVTAGRAPLRGRVAPRVVLLRWVPRAAGVYCVGAEGPVERLLGLSC